MRKLKITRAVKAGPQENKPANKKLLPSIVLAVLLVAGFGIYSLMKKDDPYSLNNKPPADACGFFTLEDAKSLLGDKANRNGVAPVLYSPTEHIDVIDCSYMRGGSGSQKNNGASVLVQMPKTKTGKTYNQYVFKDNKPQKVQDVSGYGEHAFWDPKLGVLNVLKGDKWVVLANGSLTSLSARKLDDTKKLADIVIPKL